MTGPVVFGTLEPVPLRAAWDHETRGFTPWLARNIGGLSAAVGIPLEVTGAEVAVDRFAADILARNLQDGSIVLIENQLEEGDHRHLGQILTYLAGLGARTVIWLASDFRDPHLSAMRWLNEHTVAPFGFFAVRLRVVRIGDSPYAPVFDVLERPNNWERGLQKVARESAEPLEFDAYKQEFWVHFLARHPDEASRSRALGAGSRWRSPLPSGIFVGMHVADDSINVFLRGHREPIQAVTRRLKPFEEALRARLGVPIEAEGCSFIPGGRLAIDTKDRSHWDRMSDWLHGEADGYEAALREILESRA